MVELQPGTIIDGRFEVISRLGAGGMGAVYEARQIAFERSVALKFLLDHLANQNESHARFLKEAQILSLMTHPNIGRVYAFGLWQERTPYIAMEILQGETLEGRLLSSGRLTFHEVVTLAVDIGKALQHIHSQGIIHRDLKPGNIFLVKDGTQSGFIAKLTDFGLCKGIFNAGEQKLTAEGCVVGTPLYMSPEQLCGLEITGASDRYALGCLLFQCLFGRLPYTGLSDMEVGTKHINDPIPLQVGSCSEPHWRQLLEIVHTLLNKEPQNRFRDSLEMTEALEQLSRASPPESKNDLVPMSALQGKAGWASPVVSFYRNCMPLLVAVLIGVAVTLACFWIAGRTSSTPFAEPEDTEENLLKKAVNIARFSKEAEALAVVDKALRLNEPHYKTELERRNLNATRYACFVRIARFNPGRQAAALAQRIIKSDRHEPYNPCIAHCYQFLSSANHDSNKVEECVMNGRGCIVYEQAHGKGDSEVCRRAAITVARACSTVPTRWRQVLWALDQLPSDYLSQASAESLEEFRVLRGIAYFNASSLAGGADGLTERQLQEKALSFLFPVSEENTLTRAHYEACKFAGLICNLLQRHQEAIRHFERMRRLAPLVLNVDEVQLAEAEARTNTASAYSRLRDLSGARREAEIVWASAHVPLHLRIEARSAYAVALQQEGRYEQALSEFKKVRAIFPADTGIHPAVNNALLSHVDLSIGACHMMLGQFDEARECFERAAGECTSQNTKKVAAEHLAMVQVLEARARSHRSAETDVQKDKKK